MTEAKKCDCKNCALVNKMGFDNEKDFLASFLTRMTKENDVTLSTIYKEIDDKITALTSAETLTKDDAGRVRSLVHAAVIEQMIWNAARLAQHAHVGIEAFAGEAAALWVRASPKDSVKLAEALAALLDPIAPGDADDYASSPVNKTIN